MKRINRIRGLQSLRGIAACTVVYSHAYSRAERAWVPEIDGSAVAHIHAITQIGHFGVDLFFVLSGFLMTYLHRQDFGRPGRWREFLQRRIIRIAPLYWLFSAVGLVLLSVLPSLFSYHKGIELPWAAGCFAFVPWPKSDGFYSPIIGVGWTLDYEMYFYLLFAVTMCFSDGLIVLYVSLVAVFGIGLLLMPQHPWAQLLTAPLLLEFLWGASAALVAHRLPKQMCVVLIVIATVAIALGGTVYINSGLGPVNAEIHQQLARTWSWGIPCAMIVASTVRLAPSCEGWIGRLLVKLGDASYSIYLFQVFALPAIAIVMRALHIPHMLQIDLAVAGLWIMACAAGVVCWAVVERPLTTALKKLRTQRKPLDNLTSSTAERR